MVKRRDLIRWGGTSTGLGVSLGLTGCLGDDDEGDSTPGGGSDGDNETDEWNPEEDFDHERRPFEWEGSTPFFFEDSGPVIFEGIPLDGRLTIFEGTHDGDERFVVGYRKEDQPGSSVISESGAFDGAYAEMLEEGEYSLTITTHGSWSVTVSQPEPTDAEQLPVEFSGDSPIVYGPIEFTGETVVQSTHEGESAFGVILYAVESSRREPVVERGEYDGEEQFTWDRIGWVDVIADGPWTVAFEEV